MKSDIAYGMATLRAAIERHDRPNRDLQELSREFGADIRTPFPGRHYASAQLLPAFDAAHGAYCRGLASSRALRILNALQARGDLSLSFDQLGLPPHLEADTSLASRFGCDVERGRRRHESPEAREGDRGNLRAASPCGRQGARDQHELTDSGEDRAPRKVSFE